MSEGPKCETLSPAGLPGGKMEDNAPVSLDAILQSILGRGGERFGLDIAVWKTRQAARALIRAFAPKLAAIS